MPDVVVRPARPEPFLPAGIAAAVQGADVVSDAGIGQALQGLQQTAQTLLDVATPIVTGLFAPGDLTRAQVEASDPWLFAPDLQPTPNKLRRLREDQDVL